MPFHTTTRNASMPHTIDESLAEAYDLCDLARRIYLSEDKQHSLAAIKNKDVVIIGMSKLITNMMEMLKVENLVA